MNEGNKLAFVGHFGLLLNMSQQPLHVNFVRVSMTHI